MNARISVTELFSREEIHELTTPSDLAGLWAVGSTWAVIAGTFASVAISWEYLPTWGKVLMIVTALAILAGRQLCLAILMHDASHNSLFKNKWVNDKVTDWLCAKPIWNDLHKYRAHHMRHHAKTSMLEDPDLSLVAGFPISKKSLLRKFTRDITGLTGIKFLAGRALMDMELLEWTVANDQRKIPLNGRTAFDLAKRLLKNSSGAILTNAAIYYALKKTGHAKLFWLWPIAYITPFPLFIRIRSMAEHAGMQTSHNALTNTRTTQANWIARTLVAPLRVNFHQEHHLMASVPYFKLPKMHQLLRERGFIEQPPTYLDVIDLLSNQQDSAATKQAKADRETLVKIKLGLN